MQEAQVGVIFEYARHRYAMSELLIEAANTEVDHNNRPARAIAMAVRKHANAAVAYVRQQRKLEKAP
jgi:hypothetical protein